MELTSAAGEPLRGRIALGCMGMSQSRGSRDDEESLRTIARALELGINSLDTADSYGPATNELLLGRALAGRRDEVFLATKFGNVKHPDGSRGLDGRPEYVKSACDASLSRLGVQYIDLYYQHRVDPSVPIEETWGAMSELVDAGKVRYLGISEASPELVRRAHAVHRIAASQNEYSLFSREPEDELLEVLRELGIALVAYSPLGRGFLTGAITSPEHFAPGDPRRDYPRFQGENFARNLAVVERLGSLAAQRGVTAAQLAIAWVLAQGEDVVALVGCRTLAQLEENAAAASLALSPEELEEIERLAPRGAAQGARFDAAHMGRLAT